MVQRPRIDASARERALSCLKEISTAQKEFESRRADDAAVGADELTLSQKHGARRPAKARNEEVPGDVVFVTVGVLLLIPCWTGPSVSRPANGSSCCSSC